MIMNDIADSGWRALRSERGATLIHIALAMIALLAVSALSIDAGVKWVARGQAQNAADAGALAAAIALSFDDPDDFSDTGMGKQSALLYARGNNVFGQPPDIQPADVTFPPCPDGSDDTCVRVNVFRNQERDNPLPTFFAGLVGVMDQGVRATATAQIRTGNATECLRPWAIVDRWNEYLSPGSYGPPQPLDTYDTYAPREQDREPDVYVAPTENDPGTGFLLPDDQGRQFAIHTGAPGNAAVSSGWYRNIDLPRIDGTNQGGNAYGDNIISCNGYPVAIAANDTVCPDPTAINTHAEKVYWAARGCVRVQTGVIQGQTRDGIREIIASDLGARWDSSMNNGQGGIANSAYTPSTRIVPIAVMDIGQFLQSDPSGSGGVLRIVNIFGFFIEGMGDIDRQTGEIIFDPNNPLQQNAQTVVGRLMTLPGMFTGSSDIDEDASFLRTIILVR
jgi:Putative Flp pilus-assembly TadE/G-like